MARRTVAEIEASAKAAIIAASPQVRPDVERGPFYALAIKSVAAPLADASSRVERLALISTMQFPSVVTKDEAIATARAFGETLGGATYARGLAFAFTGRAPTGGETFTVNEGDIFLTGAATGPVFEAVETRSLTAANADAYFNPTFRRYELPVRVQALAAGVAGNIAPRTIRAVTAPDGPFDGATNSTRFYGGAESNSIETMYRNVQAKFSGLDMFSRGGLPSRLLKVDAERIQEIDMTYASEYPNLFYRLPDGQCIDIWVSSSVRDESASETFSAGAGQVAFPLSRAPVLYLTAVAVNGVPASATLVLDDSAGYGRSARESSIVNLSVPASAGDLVDITYGYDGLIADLQSDLQGFVNDPTTGGIYGVDALVRYKRDLPVVAGITGTVLGTFDPTSVEQEVIDAATDYLVSGDTERGVRRAGVLRDILEDTVPGIASLRINLFCRASVGTLVEAISVPRNARVSVASGAVTARFT